MAALEEIILQIRADTGGLRRELDQVIGKINQISDEGAKASKGVEALGGSFGILSKALGAAGIGLSIGGAIKLTNDFVERSTKLEGVFGNLKLNIDKAKEATGGLVTNYDLAVAANKAMSLGLNLTSDQFASLARSAAIAGKTMGQDVGKSVDDLIIGLSRQSPKILDNLGIQIKLNEAHEIYAKKLGVSSSALTDEQKASAFTEAALEKLKVITEGAALSNQTLAGSLTMLKTKFTDATDAVLKWANSVGGDDGLTGQNAIDRINKTLAQKADPTWNDDIINKTKLAKEFALASLSAAAAVEKLGGGSGLAAFDDSAAGSDRGQRGGLGGLDNLLSGTKRNLLGLGSTPSHKIINRGGRSKAEPKKEDTSASDHDDRFGVKSPTVALTALMNNEYYRFYALQDDAEFSSAVDGALSLAKQKNAELNEATNKILDAKFKGGAGPQTRGLTNEIREGERTAQLAGQLGSSGLFGGFDEATLQSLGNGFKVFGDQASTAIQVTTDSVGALSSSLSGGFVDAISQAILAGKDFGKVMAAAIGQALLALSKSFIVEAMGEVAKGFAKLAAGGPVAAANAAIHFKSAALFTAAAAAAGAAGIGLSAAGGSGGSSGGASTARPRGVDRGVGGRGGDSRGAGQPIQGATFNYVINTVIPPNPTEASAAIASLLNGAKSAGFL